MTIVKNSNQLTANNAFFTNVQTSSYDLSGEPPPVPVPPNLIFLSNFATGAIQPPVQNPDGWGRQPDPNAYPNENIADDIALVGTPSRNGNPSVRFKLTRADWPIDNGTVKGLSPRCQLHKSISYLRFNYGEEYWVGWSVWFPGGANSWNRNQIVGGADPLFQQIHGTGASAGSPPINWKQDSNGFFCQTRFGNTEAGGLTPVEVWRTTDFPRDQWIDLVMRFKLHLTDGFVDVWVNNSDAGNPTAEYAGGTTYGGQDGNPVSQPSDGNPSHMIYNPKYDDNPAGSVPAEYLMYQAEIRYAAGPNGFDVVYPGNY
jgi:hypothetical protein